MRKWILTCSIDAVDVDHEEIIESNEEPGFWECYAIAEAHGCAFFSVDPI